MFELPKLTYAYNALEPYIDEETMKIHHDKHHQAYVDNANKSLEKYPELLKKPVHMLLMDLSKIPEDARMAFKNHGGGVANHSMFWMVMGPKAGGIPKGKIGDAITKEFGSFEKFKELFTDAGLKRFGSGWAWLVLEKGKLSIMSTPNQDTPLSEGKTPLLCVDVWEHSYYLKYRQQRAEYLKNWWNVVNWKMIDDWYQMSMK